MKRTKYNNGNGGTENKKIGKVTIRNVPNGKKPAIGRSQLEQARTEINYQEIMFVHEYLTDLDPGNALIRARLCSEQATKNHANKKGLEWLRRPYVQEYLEKAMEDRAERAKVTADRTIKEVAQIAFFDPADAFEDSGALKKIKEMPRSVRCVISELEFKYNPRDKVSYPSKIKFHDKLTALQNLLKHLGMITPDASNTLNVNYIDRQFNNQQNINVNTLVDVSDLTNDELRVIRKMVGDKEAHNLLELHKMEEQIYASQTG